MNRQQRRHPGKQAKDTENPITTQYGHNGEKVLMQWNKNIRALLLTEEQVDTMIDYLQKSKQMLHDHKAQQGNLPS